MKTLKTLALSLALVAGLTACSFEFSAGGPDWPGEASDVIEDTIAEQMDTTLTDIDCDTPPDDFAVGDSFDCTAKTEAGDEVELVATQDKEDHIEVVTTNVVTPDGLERVVTEAARLLGEQAGIDLPAENLDCGSESLVGDPPMEVECDLTDPTDGTVYSATLTITDYEEGEFDIVVN